MNKALRTALGVVNVLDHGLVADGSADCTGPLQALVRDPAIVPPVRFTAREEGTTRSVGGTCLYFPEGTYKFSTGIYIPANVNIAFRGAGSRATTLRLDSEVADTARWPIGPTFDDSASFPVPPPYPQIRITDLTRYVPVSPKSVDAWRVAGVGFDALWTAYFEWVSRRYLFHYPGSSPRSAEEKANKTAAFHDTFLGQNGWTAWIERDLLFGGNGQTPWSFEAMTLHGGGILVAGTTGSPTAPPPPPSPTGFGQRQGHVRDVRFERCPAWGLATDGARVVNVEVLDCEFIACNAGLGIRYEQSDLWTVRDCVFDGTLTMDVQIATPSVTLEGCVFRNKPAASRVFPFVHLKHLPDARAPEGPGFEPESEPPDVDESWERTELPGAAYLVDDAADPDAVRAPAFSASMMITRGIHLVDCFFGLEPDGWSRDAIVIGRWAQRAVPYPVLHDFPDVILKGALAGKTLRIGDPGSNNPTHDIVARGIVIEGCIFGPVAPTSGRPRSGIRLTVPVQGLHVLRCTAGPMDHFVYEECSTRLWLDELFIGTVFGGLVPDSVDTGELQSLIPVYAPRDSLPWNVLEGSLRTFGNIMEVRSRAPNADVALALFSLGGYGFELTPAAGYPGEGAGVVAMGNLLDSTGPAPSKEVTYQNGFYQANKDAVSGFLDPRVNMQGRWPSPAMPASLSLAFSADIEPVTGDARTAGYVAMGYFCIGGSRYRECPLAPGTTQFQLLVRETPDRWWLSGKPPAALETALGQQLTTADWKSLRSAALTYGLAQYLTSSAGTSRLGLVLYVLPANGSALRLRNLSLSVGSTPGIPLPRRPAPTGPDWRVVALEDELVAAAPLDDQPLPSGVVPDVILNSAPVAGAASARVNGANTGEVVTQ
jgi:hypothetical protein